MANKNDDLLKAGGAVLGTISLGVAYVYLKRFLKDVAKGTTWEKEVENTIDMVDIFINKGAAKCLSK